MSLVLNGTTGADKVQSGSIYPEDLVQKMTLMTAQTASGTSVDFTGIPSWAKRITVMFNGVSTNGISIVQVQIGAGTITNTGYLSTSVMGVAGGTNLTHSTTGFIFSGAVSAASIRYASSVLLNISDTTWVNTTTGVLNNEQASLSSSGTSPSLAGVLDRILITTVNGTDTFDAGTINIMYEG